MRRAVLDAEAEKRSGSPSEFVGARDLCLPKHEMIPRSIYRS